MYSFNNKQFIFKQSSGKVWNFFYEEKNGLCYSVLTKRNTWSEPVSLQKNLHPSFFADIDSDDGFYILFQDKLGNIFCSRVNNEIIKTTPVLNSKTPSKYNKYLHLIPTKNSVNIFFIIDHKNSMILAHQILSNSDAEAPKVIDYVVGNDFPYMVVDDKSGNIFAFYQSSDGKYYQIGFKKYTSSRKLWGEFIPVSEFDGDCSYPRVIADNKSTLHLCYQRQSESRQYELVYHQKPANSSAWTNAKVIHSSSYPYPEGSIAYISDSLFIFWVREDTIYYCSSQDGGSSWTKASRYPFHPGRQFHCITYKSNNPFENEKTAIRELPGNFLNGFKLAFYQDYSENIVNLSADELKNMIVESLRMIRENLAELKEAQSALKKSISDLESKQQISERDTVKNSLKLNLIENEMNRIKNISVDMQDYSNVINEMKTRLSEPQPKPAEPRAQYNEAPQETIPENNQAANMFESFDSFFADEIQEICEIYPDSIQLENAYATSADLKKILIDKHADGAGSLYDNNPSLDMKAAGYNESETDGKADSAGDSKTESKTVGETDSISGNKNDSKSDNKSEIIR